MILVTGGSGLLGNELIKQLLAQGKTVRAIYNKTPIAASFNSKNLQQFQCNILDVTGLQEAMKDVTQVYHCAAIVSFNPKRKTEMFKINIEGTANIVNTALDAGIKKMVHVSSVAALGKVGDNEMINENTNWNEATCNNSNYGKSKYLAELEVWRGIGEGLDAVIVNPTIILGNGDWNSGSSKIFRQYYNQFPWYTTGTTGFVDVIDVANAMIQLMNNHITAQRFIISAQNKTFKDIFTLIAKAFNKKVPYKKVTPFIAQMVWRLEALKSKFTKHEPLVTKETAITAMATVHFDNNKLLKYLPNFTYKKIEDTITNTCTTFLQKLNK